MELTLPLIYGHERAFQLDALSDPRKYKVLILHRRSGKTTLAVNQLVKEAMLPENAGKIFHYVCPNKNQAKKLIWDTPDMIRKYVPPEIIDKKNEVELKIFFKNGSQLYIQGADQPDTLRGQEVYGVILDEYAQMKSEVYDEIYRPVLAANGGWCWLLGTPKGKNDFYRKYRSALLNPAIWQVIHLSAETSGIIPPEALAQAKAEMTEQAFAQEFLSEFLEGSGTIFRRIRENICPTFSEPRQGRAYKVGVDLARHVDWTVITAVDRHTHELVYFDRFNQIEYNLQKARIEAVCRRYNNAPATVDETGVGVPIVEDLRRLGLVINGVTFTSETKKTLVENLALLIEQNKIRYPDIPELIRELEEYTYEILPSNKIRYTAPDGGTDDIVMSMCLAYYQIGEKLPLSVDRKPNYGFRSGYNKVVFRK